MQKERIGRKTAEARDSQTGRRRDIVQKWSLDRETEEGR